MWYDIYIYVIRRLKVNYYIYKTFALGFITLLNTKRPYVEINCQLDATDDIYCRFYCLLSMFGEPLCPSSGAREYYTDGRYL